MSSYSRQQLELYLKTIEVKADRVLDVGGSQNPIKGRTASFDVKTYHIADIAQPHETKQKPDMIIDLNQRIKTILLLEKERYDVIFCIEVMEYVYNPFQALQNLHGWLKTNGVLYISFQFVYPHHNPAGLDYLRYTSWGAKKLLKECGFKVEDEFHRRSEVMSPIELYLAEGMKMSGEYMHHGDVAYVFKASKI